MKRILLLFILITFLPLISQAAFPIEYNKSFDITNNDVTLNLKNNTVTVSSKRPIKAMQEFVITFNFANANIKSINTSSNMEMNMGKYDFLGNKINDNTYNVKLIVTKCMSGKTLWYTKVNVTYLDDSNEAFYIFFNTK